MDELLRAWETTFGCSTLPFGVAEVLLDDRGRPYDFAYRYINAAAASLTGHVAEDLLGEEAYALWGGDPIWLDHFYEAAYEGRASEFEAPSEMLQQFFRAEVFPISEGLCGFTIHDVTDWILPAQRSMEKAAAGLFFYDMRYRQMLLTEQAREQSGVDSNYISLTEFIDLTFGSTLSEEVRQKMKAFLERREAFYQEGRLPNGRWLRMSLDHTDRSERFAFGFLEDFTRTKLAEERSEQYIDIIDSLGAENFALYLVDLETQELEVYRRGEEMTAEFALASAEEGDYPAAMERYIDTFVVAEDRSRVRAEIGGEALWRRLEAGETDFSVGYRRLFGDEEQYVELRIIRLPQRDSKVILAARNVTGEMREQLRQKVALQNALDLAEHASQAKSTFLTNMSHDFRTPMNSISGFASIALDHLNDTDRVRDCLRKIMLSSDHLLSLVNDILDVSRIESGKMSFNEDIVSLPDAVIEVQGMFGEKAAASGVDLTIDVDNVAHPQVVTDPLRLNQILVNTVGNAVKFTPSGGLVTVALTELSDAPRGFGAYRLTVSDTGCGMTPEFLDRIFLPFERDGLGYANKTEGTGLGMSISYLLMTQMGGSITVESEPGCGSCFTVIVTLPTVANGDEPTLAQAPSLISPSVEGAEGRGGTERAEGAEGEVAETARVAEAPGAPGAVRAVSLPSGAEAARAPVEILVAEDNELNADIISSILTEEGFSITVAENGEEAVRLFSESPAGHFAAILMDAQMPVMDGYEASRAIRDLKRADAKTVRIFACTASTFAEDRNRALASGMDDFLSKPLNVTVMLQKLEAVRKGGAS